jgi:hypothetical protein
VVSPLCRWDGDACSTNGLYLLDLNAFVSPEGHPGTYDPPGRLQQQHDSSSTTAGTGVNSARTANRCRHNHAVLALVHRDLCKRQ